MASTASEGVCVKGNGGIVLPLFGDAEQEWPRPLRIVLYLMGLFYCFMGVAIVADVFMGAIEKITSKKTRVYNARNGKWYTYEVWNATVANLTLMALGSSAPEILLNVIDIFAKEFFLEGLGPATIVGSAAFNLLMIIAVCVVAIPSSEIRYIREMPVYVVTAMWSILAYLWLLVILLGNSPHVVEPWEGTLTFLFFPVLTLLAFLADKGYFSKEPPQENKAFLTDDLGKEEIAELEANIRRQHGEDLTDEQVARFISVQNPPRATRATYRVGATRKMFGGKRLRASQLATQMSGRLQSLRGSNKVAPESSTKSGVSSTKSDASEDCDTTQEAPAANPTEYCVVEFFTAQYAVLESAGHVTIKIVRKGCEDAPVTVHYKTLDGTAKAGEDYTPVEGELEFKAGQKELFLKVEIVDDAAYEEDEEFFVLLSEPSISKKDAAVNLGRKKITIVIIDDDDPGVLSFPQDLTTVYQQASDYEATFKVVRENGSSGEIKVNYTTEQSSALAGRDFEQTSGTLVFDDKQMEAQIKVMMKAQGRYETTDNFRLVLSEPAGGAKLDASKDGGPEKNILTVVIAADPGSKERVDKVGRLLQVKWDKSKIGHANWASQFKAAIKVNGGEEDDEGGEEEVTKMDYAMHVLTLPWKMLFALVPPVDYCGGWVCFSVSLAMIGLVTLFIGDMASLLGCVLCIPDDITAITFVALGTSLPDTFASRTAAMQDPHADASVGNVTGSNSVNVFLGLGLPWMIAAINWAVAGRNEKWQRLYQTDPDLNYLGPIGARKQGFVVKAGSLAFSVSVFSICAISCVALLYVRRRLVGGELGGPAGLKFTSAGFLTFLWFMYIALSSWKSLDESGGASCPS